MEENQNNEAVELKNAIDASIEVKATEVAKESADALEAKATELNEAIESKSSALEAQNELLQKQVDELKTEVKAVNTKSAPKMANEFKNWLSENAKEVMNDRNAVKSFELKNASIYTLHLLELHSAPYADDRQTDIEFDPHQ